MKGILHSLPVGITLLFLLLISFQTKAQISCASGVFYGYGTDGAVHELTISGGTVSLGNVVSAVATSSRYGLAIADLGGGNSFYSSGSTVVTSSYDVLSYSGSTWTSLLSNPYPNSLHNAAGKGNFLYYQYIGSSNQTGLARHSKIFQYNGSALPLLYMDTTMFMKVADIAVDNSGNIYFFSDSVPFPNTDVSRLNILSPSGTIIKSFSVSFDGDNAYGCFINDSILYVALGPSNTVNPNSLLPITISGNTATIGTPLAVPSPIIGGTIGNPLHLSFNDLASCANASIHLQETVGLSSPMVDDEMQVYPNPVHDLLNISLKNITGSAQIEIYNTMGEIVLSKIITDSNQQIEINFPAGIYMLKLISGDKPICYKLIHR